MAGSIFQREVKAATGVEWREWIGKLQITVQPSWSHEQIRGHLVEHYGVADEWAEWLTVMYGELLGRVPTGVTKDAGVQIGVRKTLPMTAEQAWRYLVSPQGVELWIGKIPSFQLEKGFEFRSEEGITGKLTVVQLGRKLRLTWQPADWDKPSRLQIYALDAAAGKATLAIHQEMLEDVYMREMMRRRWEQVLDRMLGYAKSVPPAEAGGP